MLLLPKLRGSLHDTGVTFLPGRVHSGSSHSSTFVYMIHVPPQNVMLARVAPAWVHPGVSSPQFSHRGENFTPVWDFATVSCKRETTTRFGVKSVCRESKMALSASTRWMWDDEKTDAFPVIMIPKSRSHPGMKLVPVQVFPCKHPLRLTILFFLQTQIESPWLGETATDHLNFWNNKPEDMLVYSNPVQVDLFSHINTFFRFMLHILCTEI